MSMLVKAFVPGRIRVVVGSNPVHFLHFHRLSFLMFSVFHPFLDEGLFLFSSYCQTKRNTAGIKIKIEALGLAPANPIPSLRI